MFHKDITQTPLAELALKHVFAAVDLAPNDQLETGISALDRKRNLLRMDKRYSDSEIISSIESLGPPSGTLVIIDMPKSLSVPGRWRQEEIKMHPLRLKSSDGSNLNRFDQRGLHLYDVFLSKGMTPLLYFNYWARLNYDLLVPYRSRSPEGCRALQSGIENQLDLKNMPTQLAPSSVLESMVGAYVGWAAWKGEAGKDFELKEDTEGRRYIIPQGRPHVDETHTRVRKYRRRFVNPIDQKMGRGYKDEF